MTGLDHPLVRAYLRRLDALAAALPPERRGELRADVDEHLGEALAGADDDDAVASVLARLGAPEDLVAEAGGPPVPRPVTTADDAPRLEVAALVTFALSLLLAVTFLVAFAAPLFWLAGIVLTLLSRRWTAGDKALAVLAYGVLGLPLLASTLYLPVVSWRGSCSGGTNADGSTWESCTGGPPDWWWVVALAIGLALLALWVAVGVRLYRRARRAVPEEEARGIRMG